MELGLRNYAVVVFIENSCIEFSNNKINGLQQYYTAHDHRILHKVV
jgi:hypothetical protein